MSENFVIGVDYGTDSVRTVIINAGSGQEVATSVFEYPRWKKGLYCDASRSRFRQHPLDYLEGLEHTIEDCIQKAGPETAKNIKAISVDTTGSSPVAVDKTGTPLALLNGFENNPNAMFVLWKDHTATKEAADLNQHATKYPINYLRYVGGIYSSEWFWAKWLHILKEDSAVKNACYSFVEHCDWIPFVLTGGNDVRQMKRSVCAAGHKALWAKEWNGLPPEDFFASWDPALKGLRDQLFTDAYTSDIAAGTISKEWANKLGLPDTVLIGVGAFDAHMGAVGGQIEPYHLSKVMGTSTCDMLVAPVTDIQGKLIKGICGQVSGSIIPGMTGLEAGQSAFGDAYAWFKNLITWPIDNLLKAKTSDNEATLKQLRDSIHNLIIPELSKKAEALGINANDELSIDWFNGRRTPDANQLLKGAITGINLGSDAPRIFKSIVEATCFGAKAIIDRFIEQGIPVKGLIGMGGVAKKSPYIMQVMADVTGMPIRIHRSEQTCAAGAAMFAATVAGIYKNVEAAMQSMGQGFEKTYYPNEKNTAIYKERYKKYQLTGKLLEQEMI
ncbi:MAG: ribulokinase [Chitinophagaceae bacterium]|nr:ribulokinase [Chitinophagaceae bacterium]